MYGRFWRCAVWRSVSSGAALEGEIWRPVRSMRIVLAGTVGTAVRALRTETELDFELPVALPPPGRYEAFVRTSGGGVRSRNLAKARVRWMSTVEKAREKLAKIYGDPKLCVSAAA